MVIFGYYGNYGLSKAFGKGVGYILGLLFLNTIFLLILGYGCSKYQLEEKKLVITANFFNDYF